MKNISRNNKIAIGLSVFNCIFIILFIRYCDVVGLLESHNFLDCLFNGNMTDYYASVGTDGLNANMLSRLPLLLWYLPSYIITRITGGVTYYTYFHHIWHMLFCGVIWFLTLINTGKIVWTITKDCNKQGCSIFLIGTSPIVIMSTFYSGQDELVYMLLFLLAVRFYLEDRRMLCYTCFIMCCLCCQIMIVPYMIWVVSENKNIFSIVSRFLLTLIPQWIYDIIFSRSLTYRYLDAWDIYGWYFGNGISIGKGMCSINGVIIILVLALVYLKKYNSFDRNSIAVDLFKWTFVCLGALEIIGWDQFYRKFIWIIPCVIFICVRYDGAKFNFMMSLASLLGIIQFIQWSTKYNFLVASGAGSMTQLGVKLFGYPKNYEDILLDIRSISVGDNIVNSLIVAIFILIVVNFSINVMNDGYELKLRFESIMLFGALIMSIGILSCMLFSYL